MRPAFLLCATALALAGPARADESRRFFDFAPVSKSNPVVARIDGTIAIPLSELRGYRDAERPQSITDPSNLAQKRAVLEDLINEYLYVDEAYRAGVPTSEGFVRRMDATRTMILTDFIAARASSEKSSVTAAEGAGSSEDAIALADRLFEAASITVSNEAYAILKRAAAAIDQAGAGATPDATGTASTPEAHAAHTAKLHVILDETPPATLVRYVDRVISLHQALAIYAGLPASKRPPVQSQQGLIDLIKPLILPELMAIEAMKRGIATEPAFQHKVVQNRNALLRFHAHGAIESRANDILRGPELEAHLLAWHATHPELYFAPANAADPADTASAGRPLPFAEVRARVLGDFSVDLRDRLLAEKARELRKLRTVTIDEKVLQQL